MRQMVGWRDSVVLDPTAGAARLVVWTDSVACSSCRLGNMFQYDEIIGYRGGTETGAGNANETSGDDVETRTEEGFEPIFIFSPPRVKIDEVLLTLERTRFDYPVFIDEKGLFPATNPHIPSDSRFHTFLLDRGGKVVLVGDPVNNPRLWDLYKTTIAELVEHSGT
jgi:hypothetical protein